MELRRGDIVYVCNPHNYGYGHEQAKTRPAIIVSNDRNNLFSPTVEVVYLTSREKKPLPTHVEIHSAYYPSIALCEQVSTIDKHRITNICGFCTKAEMEKVNKAIIISLALEGSM